MGVVILEGPAALTHAGTLLRPVALDIQHLPLGQSHSSALPA